jgi:hypothetical protein
MKTRQTGEGLLAIAGFLFSIGGLVLSGCATVRLDGQALGPAGVYRRTAVCYAAPTAEGRRRAEEAFRGALAAHQTAPGESRVAAPSVKGPEDLAAQLASQGYDSLLVLGLHPFVHREEDADWRSVFRVGGDELAFNTVETTAVPGGRRYVGGHVWLVDLNTGRAVWSGHGTMGTPTNTGPRRSAKAAARAVVRRLAEEKFLPETR